MKKVAHLARKFLPTTASFIYNQIIHHHDFDPALVYCETVDSVFRTRLQEQYPTYQAVHGMIGQYLYRYSRSLTATEQGGVVDFIRNFGADVLHVHYGVDALVYADLFKAVERPVLISFYGYDCTSFPQRFRGAGKTWLQNKLFKNPYVTYFTAMSPNMKEDLLELGCPEEKIIVHYHGSDPQPFLRERTYEDKENIHLLIISSLTAKKGHLFLLKAFRQAEGKTNKRLHLHLVGDGELRDDLALFVRQAGLKRVTLHGPVDYGSEQHYAYLEQADIFVHPSVTTVQGEKEGIPGALIESRSGGLPVVATYHAGIPYIVEHGQTGLLAEEHDIATLADHIVALAEDANLRERIGRAGQQYTLEYLDVANKEKDLEGIYERMLQERK